MNKYIVPAIKRWADNIVDVQHTKGYHHYGVTGYQPYGNASLAWHHQQWCHVEVWGIFGGKRYLCTLVAVMGVCTSKKDSRTSKRNSRHWVRFSFSTHLSQCITSQFLLFVCGVRKMHTKYGLILFSWGCDFQKIFLSKYLFNVALVHVCIFEKFSSSSL